MSSGLKHHWDSVYGDKSLTELSWYQLSPAASLRLITAASSPSSSVLDVGAGASSLVDGLLAAGYRDVSVLDVSSEALDAVRARLGDRSGVEFVVADLLSWSPARRYDVWHDRAVFHFLTDEGERKRYVRLAAATVPEGGVLIVGTFAADGPASCSGLSTARYDADALVAAFGKPFVEEGREREEHVTPWGVVQPFTWLTLRRT